MGIQPKMLDPDPDSMNRDPKHCFQDSAYVYLFEKKGRDYYVLGLGTSMISATLSDPPDIQGGALPERENGSEPIGTITTNMKTDSHCLLSIIMYVFIYEYSPF